jgi:hypothetical protein
MHSVAHRCGASPQRPFRPARGRPVRASARPGSLPAAPRGAPATGCCAPGPGEAHRAPGRAGPGSPRPHRRVAWAGPVSPARFLRGRLHDLWRWPGGKGGGKREREMDWRWQGRAREDPWPWGGGETTTAGCGVFRRRCGTGGGAARLPTVRGPERRAARGAGHAGCSDGIDEMRHGRAASSHGAGGARRAAPVAVAGGQTPPSVSVGVCAGGPGLRRQRSDPPSRSRTAFARAGDRRAGPSTPPADRPAGRRANSSRRPAG